MGDAQRQPLPNIDQEAKDGILPTTPIIEHHPPVPNFARLRWLRITIFTILVLSGQSIVVILGRLYFVKGGKNKWMVALVQTVGFPVLIPFLFFYPTKTQSPENHHTHKPSLSTLVSLYLFLGILMATSCILYAIGLWYLPASTYSLICASQLAFNAFFSYFLNGQKFTPFIINCLVLLAISSTLLVSQNSQDSSSTSSKTKYAIGFICTVVGSSTYGLMFSTVQFAFRKILKTTTIRAVLDITIYQCIVATLVILTGLFASKEWESIKGEMEGYKLGKVSYVMNLVWSAVISQLFSFGMVGLVFEVSSVFSNVISIVGLPIIPVFAVVIFHDKMNGVKVISMLLAIWGFISYMYQHYLDELKSKAEATNRVNEISFTERA